MSKKPFIESADYKSIIGFLLVVFGILSLILSLVGARFSFLGFIDMWGALPGFIIRLLMVVFGFVLVFVGKAEELHDSSEIES